MRPLRITDDRNSPRRRASLTFTVIVYARSPCSRHTVRLTRYATPPSVTSLSSDEECSSRWASSAYVVLAHQRE
jgi:hypothetical protein